MRTRFGLILNRILWGPSKRITGNGDATLPDSYFCWPFMAPFWFFCCITPAATQPRENEIHYLPARSTGIIHHPASCTHPTQQQKMLLLRKGNFTNCEYDCLKSTCTPSGIPIQKESAQVILMEESASAMLLARIP